MTVRIVGPDAVTLPAAIGGDRLDAVRVKRSVRLRRLPGNQTEAIGLDPESLTLAEAKRMVSAGAEIYGLEVFFELAAAVVLTRVHPLAPDRSPLPRETWSEYGVVGRSHKPIGPFSGKYYRSSLIGSGGVPLPASDWSGWIDTPPSGVTVITVADFRVIQAAHAPTP